MLKILGIRKPVKNNFVIFLLTSVGDNLSNQYSFKNLKVFVLKHIHFDTVRPSVHTNKRSVLKADQNENAYILYQY